METMTNQVDNVTRILHIIPTLSQGGAEKQLALLASHLPTARYDVHVCVLTSTGIYQQELESQGIPVHLIGKSQKLDLFAYRRLRTLIQKLRPDIVQTWLFAANSYGRQAAISSGVPHVVASERSVDRWKRAGHFYIDRYLARRTQAIIVPSKGVRDFYVQHHLSPNLFRVIANGIDTDVSTELVPRKEILSGTDIPEKSRLIGVVARLWPQKKLKDAIWAGELLSAVHDDIHVVVLGDGPERWRLERFSRQVHPEGRIHFLGHREDADKFIPHFECLWLTSAYEGLPNSIMEAMAAAIPVVATDIPGNRDLIIPGQTGYLVPVGDRASIARQTNRLLQDETLRKEMGQAGRQNIREHFSLTQMVQQYDDFYQQLLDNES
ncbi:MAG: glycosyltransferase [Pirellulaceae bacterium]|nr:glycosyltransferase [Pirellulaceae bacterium]